MEQLLLDKLGMFNSHSSTNSVILHGFWLLYMVFDFINLFAGVIFFECFGVTCDSTTQAFVFWRHFLKLIFNVWDMYELLNYDFIQQHMFSWLVCWKPCLMIGSSWKLLRFKLKYRLNLKLQTLLDAWLVFSTAYTLVVF